MPNKFLFIVCHIIGMVATSAQGNFEIELNGSAVFIDQVGKSSDELLISMNGYGSKSDLLVWKPFVLGNNLNLRLGSGINVLDYLNVRETPRRYSLYIPLKIGLDFPISKSRFEGFAQVSNYLLLNKASSDRLFNYSINKAAIVENRVYSNIELGMRIKIGKRTSLIIGTPISFIPIAATKKGVTYRNIDDPNSTEYKIWADMWGATLGIKWTLGKVEDRVKRSKEKVRIDRY